MPEGDLVSCRSNENLISVGSRLSGSHKIAKLRVSVLAGVRYTPEFEAMRVLVPSLSRRSSVVAPS